MRLAAPEVGVENETTCIVSANEHHANGRPAVAARSRQRHRVRIRRFLRARLLEPDREFVEGIIAHRLGARSNSPAEGVPDNNGVGAIGPGRDHVDRRIDDLCDPIQILTSIYR